MKWPTYLNNYVDKLVTSFLFKTIDYQIRMNVRIAHADVFTLLRFSTQNFKTTVTRSDVAF